jgi:hypothetical protein
MMEKIRASEPVGPFLGFCPDNSPRIPSREKKSARSGRFCAMILGGWLKKWLASSAE